MVSGSGAFRADAVARVGTTVGGKFLIQSVAGVGGNGIVYEAYDTALHRPVALKIPRQGRATYIRFRREAIAGASITHPNVCTLYALGQDDTGEVPFLAMERLTGDTLAVRLRREPRLPLDLAVHIIRQVLSGLGAAHARTIVHRDMKPGNIFLCNITTPPTVKIVDFGCSTAMGGLAEPEDEEPLTRVGTVVGTPAYMSPEQVSGKRDFDPRIDLFACGVVLYEMVTGRRPFHADDNKALFKAIARGTFVPASVKRPELPRYLDEVLRVALAVDRAKRFATAWDFAQALDRLNVSAAPRVFPPSDRPGSPQAERLAYLKRRFHELAVLHHEVGPQSRRPPARSLRPALARLDSDEPARTSSTSDALDLSILVELDSSSASGSDGGASALKPLPNVASSWTAQPNDDDLPTRVKPRPDDGGPATTRKPVPRASAPTLKPPHDDDATTTVKPIPDGASNRRGH